MVQKLVLLFVVISVLATGCISQAPAQGTIQFLLHPLVRRSTWIMCTMAAPPLR